MKILPMPAGLVVASPVQRITGRIATLTKQSGQLILESIHRDCPVLTSGLTVTYSEESVWDAAFGGGWYARIPAMIRNRAFRVCNMSMNLDDAQDAMQECLSRIHAKGLVSTSSDTSPEEARKIFHGFLRFVIKEWADARKKRTIREVDPDATPEVPASADFCEMKLRKIWAELNDQERVLYELRYFEGLLQAQIRDRLDIAIGTVNARLKDVCEKAYAICSQVQEGYP